jgi:hypothetical protein
MSSLCFEFEAVVTAESGTLFVRVAHFQHTTVVFVLGQKQTPKIIPGK